MGNRIIIIFRRIVFHKTFGSIAIGFWTVMLFMLVKKLKSPIKSWYFICACKRKLSSGKLNILISTGSLPKTYNFLLALNWKFKNKLSTVLDRLIWLGFWSFLVPVNPYFIFRACFLTLDAIIFAYCQSFPLKNFEEKHSTHLIPVDGSKCQ